ncbi:hypothetical protein ACFLUM_01565 [Chloroflexota bacterium]
MRAVWWLAALLPVLLGFGLRLWYALQSEPFVDEPTTLLVARAIASSGVPILPSGLFYGNDLPFSYLAGALVAVFGARILVIRAFSVAAGVLTIALIYEMGSRLSWQAHADRGPVGHRWIGLWAALLFALSPAAIIWGGRARGYSLLGLLVLLAICSFYAGITADGPGRRRVGWLLLVVAVFVHPEAGLVLPAFVLGAMILRGWRWWLKLDRLVEVFLACAAVIARVWLQTALARGQISGLETITGSRLPLEPGGNWLLRLQDVAPFFMEPNRWPWTLLALLALGGALWAAHGRRNREGAEPVLFLSACLWLVPIEMTLLLGSTYQSPRYLNMLLPVFALLAAFGIAQIVGWLGRMQRLRRWQGAMAVLATLVVILAGLPAGAAAANSTEKGFRSAFEYVKGHWRPGDRAGTVAPAYSELVLGHSDYFSLGLDYEEFVFRAADGEWVDRWLGSPLLRTPEDLAAALERGGRLWLVADEGRLRRRFSPEFAQMVWQRMELVSKTDGVMAFVSVHERPEPGAIHKAKALFGEQVALTGYELGSESNRPSHSGWGEFVALPGQVLPLTLYWQAVGPIQQETTVFVHLVGTDGESYAHGDGLPLGGLQPMSHWVEGESLPDRRTLALPSELPPGRYRLEVGLYDPTGGERLPITDPGRQDAGSALALDYVTIVAPGSHPPSAGHAVGVDLRANDDQLRLLGYSVEADQVAPGSTLGLTLFWQALDPVAADYSVFVHLLVPAGTIWGQGDGPPAGGFYPTSAWDPGEVVVDKRLVAVDAGTPPGVYQLAVGLYELSTGARLSSPDGDRVMLGDIEVAP